LTPSEAQERWDRFIAQYGAAPKGKRKQAAPPKGRSWEDVAKAYEVVIRRIVAGEPEDFALSGAAREKRAPRGRDEADEAEGPTNSGAKVEQRR
jgi:hypothetical protein